MGEPASFLDHVYRGQHSTRMPNKLRYCGQNTEPCLNREFPRGELKNFPYSHNFRILSWSDDMEVMQRNERSDIVSWQTGRLHNSTKFLLHALITTTLKEEEMKSVGELSQVCSQIFLKCLCLAHIGRVDILWSVNKLARSITKWTKACDKRLNRLISYIHHTCEQKQYCHVGNTAKTMQTWTVSRLRFCGRS